MRATIYQPRYFPQLHYFNRMLRSDVFVFLDDAQYTKSLRQEMPRGEKRIVSFQSDTPVKTSQGQYMLTIPIRHDGYSPMNKTSIDYSQRWHKKHLIIIKSAYNRAPYFFPLYEKIKEVLHTEYDTLATLNIYTTLWMFSYLYDFHLEKNDITIESINKKLEKQDTVRLKKIILGSGLGVVRPEGLQKGTEWTAAICQKIGATEYFHGETAKQNYMDTSYYLSRGITPVMQKWQCRNYQQQFPRIPFLPNPSLIDLLFNVGRSEAQRIVYDGGG